MVHHPAIKKRKGEGVALRILVSSSSREDPGEIVPGRHEQGPFLSLCEFEKPSRILYQFHSPLDSQATG